MLATQLCLTLCDSMDYSLPGSSVPGSSQARILEWVAIPCHSHLVHSVSGGGVEDKPGEVKRVADGGS